MIKGFTCGVFDLFHAGHSIMLEECKRHCDFLVVALNSGENLSNDKNSPIYSVKERKIIMESIRYVDEVLVYSNEAELTEIMKNNNFDLRFLGNDYKSKPITSPNLISSIIYLNRDHGYSSSLVREKVKKTYNK